MNLTAVLTIFSSLCFLTYAIQCLTTTRMRTEFERYGVPQLRRLTGVLQVLAGIGLLVGLRWRPALTIASGGLMVMMIVALAVRVRIKDGIVRSLPAFTLMVVNGLILVRSLQ